MEFISITLHSDKGSIHCQQRSTKQQQIIKYPVISFPRRAFFFFFLHDFQVIIEILIQDAELTNTFSHPTHHTLKLVLELPLVIF